MMNVKQVARRCGVSESLVYSWAAVGVLPHYRAGRPGKRGKILIDPDELEGFIAGMRSKLPAAEPLKHLR